MLQSREITRTLTYTPKYQAHHLYVVARSRRAYIRDRLQSTYLYPPPLSQHPQSRQSYRNHCIQRFDFPRQFPQHVARISLRPGQHRRKRDVARRSIVLLRQRPSHPPAKSRVSVGPPDERDQYGHGQPRLLRQRRHQGRMSETEQAEGPQSWMPRYPLQPTRGTVGGGISIVREIERTSHLPAPSSSSPSSSSSSSSSSWTFRRRH